MCSTSVTGRDCRQCKPRHRVAECNSRASPQPLPCLYLYDGCADAAIEPDPVDGGDDAVARHRAEDDRAQPVPLLCEVTGVDLSKEHCQDHGQHSDQVDLAPVLWREE